MLISNIAIVFFLILAQKYPNKAFLVPNLAIFIFSRNFAIRQSRGCWVQIWQYNFQFQVQEHPNQAFLVTNLRICIFAPNFATRQIRGRWFEKWQQYSQIPVPRYGNLTKNFYFLHESLQQGKFEGADVKYDNVFSKLLPRTIK